MDAPRKRGRPALGITRRDFKLSDEHWQQLVTIGEGDATRGLRRVLDRPSIKAWAARREIRGRPGMSEGREQTLYSMRMRYLARMDDYRTATRSPASREDGGITPQKDKAKKIGKKARKQARKKARHA